MPSLFPGIDPFIEDQGRWRDFHATFIGTFRDELNDRLPENYLATIDERVGLVEARVEDRSAYPDVAILGETLRGPGRILAASPALDLEPVTIPMALLDEYRELFIEVYQLPARELVAVVELLLPSNKKGPGRQAYLTKRNAVAYEPSVHLIELDLLCGGYRLPMQRPLPPGDAYVVVSRAEARPDSEVYAWSIRRVLPTIRFPLATPDPDLLIDLGMLYTRTFHRGRYERAIDYRKPLNLPLAPEDRGWAEALASGEPA